MTAAGMVALLVVVALAWLWRAARNKPVAAVSPTAVAVLPFAVHGTAESQYLSEGLVDLLSTNLNGAGELRSVDTRALLGYLRREAEGPGDPKRGQEVARRFGAGMFVLGNVTAVRTRLRIAASLYDPSRSAGPIEEVTVEGEASELFKLVDSLTTKLLAAHGGRGRGFDTRFARTAALTTTSLPALKAYLKGEAAVRAGQFDSAVTALQRAIELDSTFALAYYRLSIAAEYTDRNELAAQSAQQALRHADRLSVRDRMLLDARVAVRDGDVLKGERQYRAIVADHPEDIEAWFQLGELAFHPGRLRGDPLEAAREPFERVLIHEPGHTGALLHLARVAAIAGRKHELDSLVSRLTDVNPQGERTLDMRVLRAFAIGNEADVARVTAELRQAPDLTIPFAAWNVGAFLSDIDAATRLARMLVEPQRPRQWRALGHVIVAHLALARGRWGAARSELAAVRTFDRGAALEYTGLLSLAPFLDVPRLELEALRDSLLRWDAVALESTEGERGFLTVHDDLHPHVRVYLLGLLSERLGDRNSALRFASELDRLGGSSPTPAVAESFSRSVRAHVAGAISRSQGATELEQLRLRPYNQFAIYSPFLSLPHERFVLADMLDELDRDDEAIRWYGTFSDYSIFDLVYLAPSHLRRARIHDHRNEGAQAAKHYARFVEIWKDADPELQVNVEAARRRLAALQGAPR